MLHLDLLRHGEAEATSPAGDAGRPLSPAGRAAVQALAEQLALEVWRPGRAFASPLHRAQQTARLVLDAVNGPAAIVLAELEPQAEPRALYDALRREGVAEGRVLLVGHQPLLGRVVADLAGEADLEIAAGTLVSLDCPRGLLQATVRLARVLAPTAS